MAVDIDELDKAFEPIRAAARAHAATRPGVTDLPCVCCGLTWYCDVGANGKVYCDICIGRGHDDEEEDLGGR